MGPQPLPRSTKTPGPSIPSQGRTDVPQRSGGSKKAVLWTGPGVRGAGATSSRVTLVTTRFRSWKAVTSRLIPCRLLLLKMHLKNPRGASDAARVDSYDLTTTPGVLGSPGDSGVRGHVSPQAGQQQKRSRRLGVRVRVRVRERRAEPQSSPRRPDQPPASPRAGEDAHPGRPARLTRGTTASQLPLGPSPSPP